MLNTYTPLRSRWSTLRLAIVPLMVIGVTASLGFLFHLRGEQVVENILLERMVSTVAIAAMNIDPVLVERIHTSKDTKDQAYKTLVTQLYAIRALAPHMRFAYIMRRTDDPLMLSFVADADGLSPLEELDVNHNGVVDADEKPGQPGDLYPVNDIPMLQGQAFMRPIVEADFTVDQWGQLLSAFAPIVDAQGNAIAVLGIDMQAEEFFRMTQDTFSMVAVLLVCLIGIILAVYISLAIRARHMESLEELDAERTALLDLATHQLGMPLATFRWWLELLKERDNGKFCKRGDVCDQLQEGIDRMDSIIKGLHEASSLRQNVNETNNKCSITTAVKAVAVDLKKAYALKKQTLHISVSKNCPRIGIDEKLCRGMFRELLENASFYSPNKSSVKLTATPVRRGVEIKIQDHGYGIPKQDLPKIFQQFKRGSNASKYKPAGNGLGLFIVRRIVERSHGKIRIDSELDHGSTVTLFLPLAR